MIRALAAAVVLASASPVAAEEWISLGGGRMEEEMDFHSIGRHGAAPFGTMRLTLREKGRVMVVYYDMAARCQEGALYIIDSATLLSGSQQLVPMPNVPERDRIIRIPAGNAAFNNLHAYLCGL